MLYNKYKQKTKGQENEIFNNNFASLNFGGFFGLAVGSSNNFNWLRSLKK